MNIHSLQKSTIISMNIDEKIDSIRNATIQSISRNGLSNSSVSGIAKIAGVSDGYLYRHYAGKDDLVHDVLNNTFTIANETMEQLLESCNTIDSYLDVFIDIMMTMAREETDRFKFLILIQNDFSYSIDVELVNKMKYLCLSILDKCIESKVYRKDLSVEDIYLAFIVIPQQYIKLILKDDFCITMSTEVMNDKIKKMIIGALK